MISDAIALIDFLRKNWTKYSVKSAMFNSDGELIEGDDFIKVDKVSVSGTENMWFYKVHEKVGYVFVYMPVIPSLSIDYGTLNGAINPNSNLFRFVSNPLAKFTSGGAPNVVADFIVFAYKTKDLLSGKES